MASITDLALGSLRFLGHSLSAPIDQRHETVVNNISKCRTDIAECASVIHASQTKRLNEFIRQSNELQAQESKATKRRALLNSLTSVNYIRQHEILSRTKHPGTCGWILKDRGFATWVNSSENSSFACYGIPGSGKSVLTSHVVNSVRENHLSSGARICYHYCEYSDKCTLKTAQIFASFSKQLLETVEISREIESLISEHFVDGSGTSPPTAFDLFERAVALFGKVFLVIDGLDELAKCEQSEVVRASKSLLRGNRQLLLYLSCRREEIT